MRALKVKTWRPCRFWGSSSTVICLTSKKRKSGPLKHCEGPWIYDIRGPNDPWECLLILTPVNDIDIGWRFDVRQVQKLSSFCHQLVFHLQENIHVSKTFLFIDLQILVLSDDHIDYWIKSEKQTSLTCWNWWVH